MSNQTEPNMAAVEEIVVRFSPKRQNKVLLSRGTRLQEDLEIDSPRMIDIVLEVEDRFGIALEDFDVQEAQTIGDLLDLIERRSLKKEG